MRALLFFALIFVIFILVRMGLKRIRQMQEETEQQVEDNSNREPKAMIACTVCEVHLPLEEALILPTKTENEEGLYACCEDHLEQLKSR